MSSPGILIVADQGSNAHLLEDSRDWTVNDLAMRLYLHDQAEFRRAHQAYAVDMLEHFTEYRGKHPVEIQWGSARKQQMVKEMKDFARNLSGGTACQVEDFKGDDKFALFVYHEDEETPLDRFDDTGHVVPDWQRPVVRLAAVFYPDTCTLLVKAPRKESREKLRDLFERIFIGQSHYFEDLSKSPRYNFNPLRDPNFSFPTHPKDGITAVSIGRITVVPPDPEMRRMIIDVGMRLTLSDLHRAFKIRHMDLGYDHIDGVRLQFEFEGTSRSRLRTVCLSNPGSTNLRDTPRDRLIRRYLREWGFDERKSAFAIAVPTVSTATVA